MGNTFKIILFQLYVLIICYLAALFKLYNEPLLVLLPFMLITISLRIYLEKLYTNNKIIRDLIRPWLLLSIINTLLLFVILIIIKNINQYTVLYCICVLGCMIYSIQLHNIKYSVSKNTIMSIMKGIIIIILFLTLVLYKKFSIVTFFFFIWVLNLLNFIILKQNNYNSSP